MSFMLIMLSAQTMVLHLTPLKDWHCILIAITDWLTYWRYSSMQRERKREREEQGHSHAGPWAWNASFQLELQSIQWHVNHPIFCGSVRQNFFFLTASLHVYMIKNGVQVSFCQSHEYNHIVSTINRDYKILQCEMKLAVNMPSQVWV